MANADILKQVLREADYPFFTDEQLAFYLDRNKNNVTATTYQCLLIKSENTNMAISGLSMADTSKYFLRLAREYKPNNSGLLGGN